MPALLRTPTRAEKQELGRGLRVFAWGLILLLLAFVLSPDLAWIPPLLAAVALIAYGASGLRRAASVRSWLRVPGRVVGTEIGEVAEAGRVSMHTYYHPVVEFEYATSRGTFTARGYTIAPADHRSLDRAEAGALLADYRIGAEVEAYVSPADHARAVVRPDISRRRRSQYLAALVAGVLVCAVSVWAALP